MSKLQTSAIAAAVAALFLAGAALAQSSTASRPQPGASATPQAPVAPESVPAPGNTAPPGAPISPGTATDPGIRPEGVASSDGNVSAGVDTLRLTPEERVVCGGLAGPESERCLRDMRTRNKREGLSSAR